MQLVVRLSILVLSLEVIHLVDHARQDRPTPAELTYVGALGFVATAVVLTLALRRHRFAPAAAVLVGLGTAVGFVAIHVVPHWSGALSDPYAAAHLDATSWITMLVPALAGLALGVAGLRQFSGASRGDGDGTGGSTAAMPAPSAASASLRSSSSSEGAGNPATL